MPPDDVSEEKKNMSPAQIISTLIFLVVGGVITQRVFATSSTLAWDMKWALLLGVVGLGYFSARWSWLKLTPADAAQASTQASQSAPVKAPDQPPPALAASPIVDRSVHASATGPGSVAVAVGANSPNARVNIFSDQHRSGGPKPTRPPPPPLQASPVHHTSPWPDVRSQAGVAYAEDRNALVVVGGYRDGKVLTDVAEWSRGEGWRIHESKGNEQALTLLKDAGLKWLTYDAHRKRLNLFVTPGNTVLTPQHIAVLQWAEETGEWTLRSPATENSPKPFGGVAVTYDTDRRRTVLLTPEAAPSQRIRVWEWDGTSGAWEDRTNPDDRLDSPFGGPGAIAYDEDRHRLVMFGGRPPDGRFSWDTWEWDGGARQWSKHTPDPLPNGWPAGRVGAGAAFDKKMGGVVIFGGSAPDKVFSDAWFWDGSNWSNVTPASPGPESRTACALVYLRQFGRLALFGGVAEAHVFDDFWLLESGGLIRAALAR